MAKMMRLTRRITNNMTIEKDPKALNVPLSKVINQMKWTAGNMQYAEIEGLLTRALVFLRNYQTLINGHEIYPENIINKMSNNN
jgi:hypothetical protein